MERVYVFGHQNPDTDSICSAIAYAKFKQLTGMDSAKPYRLGSINKETKFVLDYFGVEEPEFLPEISIQVKDLDLHKPHIVSRETPVKKVWEIIKTVPKSKLIPILDDFNKIEGIATMGNVAQLVLDMPAMDISIDNEILYENLINCVEGKPNRKNYPSNKVEGRIYIGTQYAFEDMMQPGDVIVTNKIESIKKILNNKNCMNIILTEGQKYEEETDKFIIHTDQSTYKVVNSINQSVSISSIMKKKDIEKVYSNQKVDEIRELLHSSSHRNFPVVDADENFIGIISRRHLIFDIRKNVILVDHNEKGQSVTGLENATILEVIDHHRIADIETDGPLFIRSEPVGCTSTLIYKMFNENIIPISREIAGIMLGAILSDTLILTSSTCTNEDVRAAERLARVAEVDLKDFGNKMFSHSTSLENLDYSEYLEVDRKLFVIGKSNVYIAQINTLKLTEVLLNKDKIKDAMDDFCQKSNADLCVFLITDIHLGGSEILVAGDEPDYAKKAFGIDEEEYSIFLSGVTSRKKQIVPRLNRALKGAGF
ncbi:MAG: putative manganese-dependent inorganic diphosphatase [Lachnospirales bacterium]